MHNKFKPTQLQVHTNIRKIYHGFSTHRAGYCSIMVSSVDEGGILHTDFYGFMVYLVANLK